MPKTILIRVIHFLLIAMCLSLSISIAGLSIAFTALFILSFLRLGNFDWPVLRREFPYALWIFTLIGALAITMLYSGPDGFRELFKLKGLVVVPFIWWLNRDLIRKYWRIYLASIVMGCVFSGIFVALFYTYSNAGLSALVERIDMLKDLEGDGVSENFGGYSPFINRLLLSYVGGVSVLVSAYFIQRGYKRAYFIAAIPVLLIMLVILGGRASQLALVASSIIWIVRFLGPHVSEKWNLNAMVSELIIGVMVILAITIVGQLAYSNLKPISDRYDQTRWEIRTYRDGSAKPEELYHYTTVRRWESWRNSVRLFASAPLTGLGIGDYYPEMRALYQREKIAVPPHGHNMFLFFGVSGGILAFLVFVGTMIVWYRKVNPDFPMLAASMLVFFICIFLFDVPLRRDIGNFLYSIVLSTLLLARPLNKAFTDEVV